LFSKKFGNNEKKHQFVTSMLLNSNSRFTKTFQLIADVNFGNSKINIKDLNTLSNHEKFIFFHFVNSENNGQSSDDD